ncbi:MAG: ADP-ribose pyrophosphatase [Ectothiorhodospiraceae bacterium]|nr:ADP-ribose pyrophosphatase [Ectothiorhodospiraceae bacterium]
MASEFSVTNSELKYDGRVFTIVRDEVKHRTGYDTVREVVRHNGGAVIIALFDNNDVLLIRQYRYPVDTMVYELPAGKLDPGEDPEACARRELEEEAGLRAASFKRLTAMTTTPGFCDEVLHIYMATGLEAGKQRLEQGEESIELYRVPMAQAVAMCRDGRIADGKTVTGIMLAALEAGALGIGK